MSVLFIHWNLLIPPWNAFTELAGGPCCNTEAMHDLTKANTDILVTAATFVFLTNDWNSPPCVCTMSIHMT